jgi:hypothetical protein
LWDAASPLFFEERNGILPKRPNINKVNIMLTTYHYVILPKPELLEKLSALDKEDRILFSEPELWEEEGGGRSPWTQSALEARVKLLYVSYLLGFYDDEKICKFLKDLIGNPPYGIEHFDKWWIVHQLRVDEDIAEVEDEMTLEDFEAFQKTGIGLLDAWIEKNKKSKAKKIPG